MQAYWTLTRRELGGYFISPTGYIVIAAAALLMGWSFSDLVLAVRGVSMPMPPTELFFKTMYFWLILLVTTPVITMRLFASERASGTYETLMTSPVSDFKVVMAKFTAAVFFYIAVWLPLLGCILVVRRYTNDPSALDAGSLASTFLGILLFGGLFIAAGCCASALTRSQVVAVLLTLLFGASLILLAFLANQVSLQSNWQAKVFASFDLFEQMHDFARGAVDTRPVIFLFTLTLFFLFLTLRIIESRRWK
jgi:ABC-2 type transport system permease protein